MDKVGDGRITLYWDDRVKVWHLVALSRNGSVLARTTVDSSVSWDRVSSARAVEALRTEMHSWLF